jgi:hypothetical protein
MISYSGIFYSLEALLCLISFLKLARLYGGNKNEVTRNFTFLFLFLSLAFFSCGVPSIVAPENNFIINLFSIISEVFMFAGFAFGMRSFSVARFKKIPSNLISLSTILTGAVIVGLNLSIFGSSFLDEHGLIEWNLHPLAIAIYIATILFTSASLSFEFFRTAIKNSETRLRSLLLGFSTIFLAIGGAVVIMRIDWQLLLLGHQMMSLGAVFFSLAFFFIPKKTAGI